MKRPALMAALAIALCAIAAAAEPGERAFAALAAGDYPTARLLLEPLAEGGDAFAAAALALLNERGLGTVRDPAAAARWYRRAADAGLATAQFDLGIMHYRGSGGPRDPQRAAAWWRRAAEAGIAAARYNLGLLHLRGEGLPADFRAAQTALRDAAEQGVAPAQYALGVLALQAPEGPDLDRAFRWFHIAATAGYAPAQHNLAVLLDSGALGTRDRQAAQTWRRRAAAGAKGQAGAAAAPPPAAAEPATEPVSIAVAAAPAEIRGPDWIAAQDPRHFTVQVATGDDERGLLRFLRRTGLAGQAAYFSFESHNGRRYSAIVGAFAELSAARQALEGLPEAARRTGPWIRRMGDVQASISGP